MNRREMIGGTVAAAVAAAIGVPSVQQKASAAFDAGFYSVPQPWRQRAVIHQRDAIPWEGWGCDPRVYGWHAWPHEIEERCFHCGQCAASKLNELCEQHSGEIAVTLFGPGLDVEEIKTGNGKGGKGKLDGSYAFRFLIDAGVAKA